MYLHEAWEVPSAVPLQVGIGHLYGQDVVVAGGRGPLLTGLESLRRLLVTFLQTGDSLKEL